MHCITSCVWCVPALRTMCALCVVKVCQWCYGRYTHHLTRLASSEYHHLHTTRRYEAFVNPPEEPLQEITTANYPFAVG